MEQGADKHSVAALHRRDWGATNAVEDRFTRETDHSSFEQELASAIRQYTKVRALRWSTMSAAHALDDFQVYQKTNLQKERGTDVQMEMGDVFSYLFQLASMLNVDLDDMWFKHQSKIVEKQYEQQKFL
jgi:NTP pyrophosphatase (non-canonical NTP hydrolase)